MWDSDDLNENAFVLDLPSPSGRLIPPYTPPQSTGLADMHTPPQISQQRRMLSSSAMLTPPYTPESPPRLQSWTHERKPDGGWYLPHLAGTPPTLSSQTRPKTVEISPQRENFASQLQHEIGSDLVVKQDALGEWIWPADMQDSFGRMSQVTRGTRLRFSNFDSQATSSGTKPRSSSLCARLIPGSQPEGEDLATQLERAVGPNWVVKRNAKGGWILPHAFYGETQRISRGTSPRSPGLTAPMPGSHPVGEDFATQLERAVGPNWVVERDAMGGWIVPRALYGQAGGTTPSSPKSTQYTPASTQNASAAQAEELRSKFASNWDVQDTGSGTWILNKDYPETVSQLYSGHGASSAPSTYTMAQTRPTTSLGAQLQQEIGDKWIVEEDETGGWIIPNLQSPLFHDQQTPEEWFDAPTHRDTSTSTTQDALSDQTRELQEQFGSDYEVRPDQTGNWLLPKDFKEKISKFYTGWETPSSVTQETQTDSTLKSTTTITRDTEAGVSSEEEEEDFSQLQQILGDKWVVEHDEEGGWIFPREFYEEIYGSPSQTTPDVDLGKGYSGGGSSGSEHTSQLEQDLGDKWTVERDESVGWIIPRSLYDQVKESAEAGIQATVEQTQAQTQTCSSVATRATQYEQQSSEDKSHQHSI